LLIVPMLLRGNGKCNTDCGVAFSALPGVCLFFARPKKGTKKKGARVSCGCAVPSPACRRRAARKLVLRTRIVRAAVPPPWLRASAAPDGELPPNGRHCEERSDEAIQKNSGLIYSTGGKLA